MSSYAFIVRDAMIARIKSMPNFAGFTFGTNKAETVQPEQIPRVGIYFINQDMLPDGDINAGEPRFHHIVLYGFSIVIQNNDAAAAEYTLDTAWLLLCNRLFTDPTLYLNRDAQIQGFARANRTHQFGAVGANNAIPIAECRFTLTIDLGVENFPPLVPDVLMKVRLDTRYPTADADPAEIQQVGAEWDLPTAKEKETKP
jgi:hypothetical protein